ncbi:MAG: hypothetical protein IJS47_06770 [Clostridia bacterium]|nr:hypothetical protein [Clostridia bacterium]
MLKYHFKEMGEEEKELAKNWSKRQEPKSSNQSFFMSVLADADDSFIKPYKIQTMESTLLRDGLAFVKNKKVAIGYSIAEFENWAEKFYPDKNSRLATLGELYIFYAYRGALNFWTLDDLCDYSSAFGNYNDAPHSVYGFELAGRRNVAGYCDGIGNTTKLCKFGNYIYAICGGYSIKSGADWPIAGHVDFTHDYTKTYNYANPVIACD